MASSRFPIPQGTLDMLILQILSWSRRMGTESHTVWTAEKLRQIALTIARNCPNSAIRTLKLN